MAGSLHIPASVLIVGGGPAGLAPLLACARGPDFDLLLGSGIVIVHDGSTIGSGELGKQPINSDSTAEALLDAVLKTKNKELCALQHHPAFLAVAAHAGASVPLHLVGDFLSLVGTTLASLVVRCGKGRVLLNCRALSTQQLSSTKWRTQVFDRETGHTEEIYSRSMILATGASQPEERLYRDSVAGHPLLPLFRGKVLQSGYVLSAAGLADVAGRLRHRSHPSVVIVGGSASAGATACTLLSHSPSRYKLLEAAITILHRRPLRIFYESVREAHAEGYREFAPEDVCALTGRVYRLGGFRLDSRELIMRARGIGGRPPEPRLRLLQIKQDTHDEAQNYLRRADIIVAAMGYRPRILTVLDAEHNVVGLRSERDDTSPLVDNYCRVLDSNGSPIEGLFGIGLATGRSMPSDLGGESSYEGQLNSLWLWQNTLGLRVARQVLERCMLLISSADSVQHGSKSTCTNTANIRADRPSIPLVVPNPPHLSLHTRELAAIERSGVYSNYGPVNQRLEDALIATLFQGGACVTVCNATIGLMIAIREVLGDQRKPHKRFALMPSFTFAAAAHAALWNGLTPLFCDIDPETWLPCAQSEQDLLGRFHDQIAVVVPYATFGNLLDLSRYTKMAEDYNIPIVVDAASSLGSRDYDGRAFGAEFPWAVVHSMHATKVFSVGEGGVIYSSDRARIARLRTIGSFGFGASRTATMAGLNSKLSEVAALTALLKLDSLELTLGKRRALNQQYLAELPDWQSQRSLGNQAFTFRTVLVPETLAPYRDGLAEGLQERGIGSAKYYSPHLAEQPYFWQSQSLTHLPTTDKIARRVLTLPMSDFMPESMVSEVCLHVQDLAAQLTETAIPSQPWALNVRANSVTSVQG